MGTVFAEIDDEMRRWVDDQIMFFVGTAPSGDDGHVNVSPKGDMRSFAILGPRQIAYLDLFGSGIETVAHLKQNGRIVVMMCSFGKQPRVVRFHGSGRVVERHDAEFDELRAGFADTDELETSLRSIIVVDVTRIADSCGFVVPMIADDGEVRERKVLYRTADAWIRQRGPDAITQYCDVNNGTSIDGIAALAPSGLELDDSVRERSSHDGKRL